MTEKKYRIKLGNGRIIGPLNLAQIAEINSKGHLIGDEQIQLFPQGSWRELSEFQEIQSLLVGEILKENGVVVAPLASVLSEQAGQPKIKDEQIIKPHSSSGASEKNKQVREFDFLEDELKDPSREKTPKNLQLSKVFEKEVDVATSSKVDGVEKTKVAIKRNKILSNASFETKVNPIRRAQTVVEDISSDDSIKLEAPNKINESEKRPTEEIPEVSPELPVVVEVSSSDRTMVKKIDEDLFSKTQVRKIEIELQEEQDFVEKGKKDKEEDKKSKQVKKNEKKEETKEELKKKRFKLVFVVAILAFVFVYLFEEDDTKKKIEPILPQIVFPTVKDVEDVELSKQYYKEGLDLMDKFSYLNQLEMSKKFRMSLENSLDSNPALGPLVDVYSELLIHHPSPAKASIEVFKLIELGRSRILSDQNLTVGSAKFFLTLDRPKAAYKIMSDYLRVYRQKESDQKERMSIRFFSTYLDTLLELGLFDKAKEAFDKISSADKKLRDVEGYRAITRFYTKNDNFQEALAILNEAIEKYPASVTLRIMRADVNLKFEKYKEFEEDVSIIQELQAEKSPVYYAKLLEYRGTIFAIQKKTKEASALFLASLKIKENPDLRSKLATIVQSKDNSPDLANLISESKAIDLINQSKSEIKNDNWTRALLLAIEAKEAVPNYIPAILFAAKVQIERGFFEEAISSLTQAQSLEKGNANVTFMLVNAYLESYKLEDAFATLSQLNDTPFKDDWRYSSNLAKFYFKKNQFIESVKWFKESLKRNPLNDKDFFELGSLYLKYKKFDEAKVFIQKAIALDPSNSEYQITYSQILYEMDNVDIAIGYLRDILEDFPEDAEILAQMAIYYYRSGQFKSFEDYKKRAETAVKPGKKLYAFLVKANKLEDKIDETIQSYEKLLQSDPGDLKSAMEYGEFLITHNKISEAEVILEKVKSKLPSYPKLKFYLANIKLLQGKEDEALVFAEEEIKLNPSLEYGHNLVGQIYTKKEDYAKALEHFKKAQQINQNSVEAILGLAWIKFQQNQIDAALDLYLKCAQLDPNNDFVHKQLGYAYKSLGQHQLAIESFKVYLELNPDAQDKGQIETMIKTMQ